MRTLWRARRVLGGVFAILFLLSFIPGFVAGVFGASIDGLDYVNLVAVGRKFQLEAAWVEPGKRVLLRRDRTKLEFGVDSREVSVNGMRLFLGDPVRLHLDYPHISRIDYESSLRPLLEPGAVSGSRLIRKIVIDPGHGGTDQGTGNRQLRLLEKDLALAVSRRLAVRLGEEGYQVSLTRSEDHYLSLEKRAESANAAGADLFVSVHFNSAGKPEVNGIETYILTPRGQRSTGAERPAAGDAVFHAGNRHDHWNGLAGFVIHRQLLRDLGSFDRGLKRARFSVLRNVDCPALLVEGGYLSNLAEAERMRGAEFQEKLVESLVSGINRFREVAEQVAAMGN